LWPGLRAAAAHADQLKNAVRSWISSASSIARGRSPNSVVGLEKNFHADVFHRAVHGRQQP
jgi:hypothetical protein